MQSHGQQTYLLTATHIDLAKFSGDNDRVWNEAKDPIALFFNRLVIPRRPPPASPNTALDHTEHFYCRENELSQMERYLVDGATSLSTSSLPQNKGVILSSRAPHTGRTQLAAKFCHDYQRSFGSILWFNAMTDEQFHKSCYDNAQKLGLLSDVETVPFQQHDRVCEVLRDFFASKLIL